MALSKQTIQQPFDIDAQRFIYTAGITNFDQKRAISYLVKGLKSNNLWVKMSAIYPMVGGNLWSCKFNLKNPIDSDLAYRLSFVASPTITYRGVDWNGTTQYANTNLTPSADSIITLNSGHISYYSREDTATTNVDFGGNNNPTLNYFTFGAKNSYGINSALTTSSANANSSGFFIVSRLASTLTTQYKNGASVNTSANVSTTVPTVPIYMGCRNVQGTGASNFSDRQCAFASIGGGLTTTEVFIFNQIVQQFQIILQRQV